MATGVFADANNADNVTASKWIGQALYRSLRCCAKFKARVRVSNGHICFFYVDWCAGGLSECFEEFDAIDASCSAAHRLIPAHTSSHQLTPRNFAEAAVGRDSRGVNTLYSY